MISQNTEVPVWLVTVIAAIVFGGLAALAFWRHIRKLARLKRLAQELGLRFYEEGEGRVLLPAYFHLFSDGLLKTEASIGNLLQGAVDNIEISVFEFCLYTGSDPHHQRAHGYAQTVAMFVAPDLNMPDFILRPERLRHKVASTIGEDDIDFDDTPRFSRKYLLRSSDQQRVCDLFTLRVRSFLERHPGYIAQGKDHTLVYYRPTRMLEPVTFGERRIRALVQGGLELVGLFGK